jgi:hypothetical protein
VIAFGNRTYRKVIKVNDVIKVCVDMTGILVRRYLDTDTQREDHVKTHRDNHPQVTEKSLEIPTLMTP